MNAIDFCRMFDWINADYSRQWTLVLVHFLWQGFLIAAVYAIASRLLRRMPANARYVAGVTALLAMAACLPVTFWAVSPARPIAKSVVPTTSFAMEATENNVPVRHQPNQPIAAEPAVNLAVVRSPAASIPDRAVTTSLLDRAAAMLQWASPYATAFYLCGVAVMLLRMMLGLWGGRRLRQACVPLNDGPIVVMLRNHARRLGLRVLPAIAYCRRISAPMVLGLVRPMILLPAALATGLTAEQFTAVLLHELAHIRRLDLLVNVLQRLVEAVLFFHPAVWWLSRRISLERENACDDLVLRLNCGRTAYADALLRVAEICVSSDNRALLDQAALAATGGSSSQLKRRVLRLLGMEEQPQFRLTTWGILATTAILAALIITPLILRNATAAVSSSNVEPMQNTADIKPIGFETPWGEPFLGLRTHLTSPNGTEYRQGTSLILLTEMQNISDKYIAFSSMTRPNVLLRAEDTDGKWLGISASAVGVSPWEGRQGALAPKEILRWEIPFNSLRFIRKFAPGMDITLRAIGPVQRKIPGKLPIELTSNTICMAFKDSFPPVMKATDLRDKWSKSMTFIYQNIPGIFGREEQCKLQIDGEGHAILVVVRSPNVKKVLPEGRSEAKLSRQHLDQLAKLLHDQPTWNLEQFQTIANEDEPEIKVCVVAGSTSMIGRFPEHVVRQQPALAAIQREAQSLMPEVEPPFGEHWNYPSEPRRTSLDIRIAAINDSIAPISKQLTNGRTDVLELPIRIENRAKETITANIAHEWYGGIWPTTDLGASVKKLGDKSNRRWPSEVFLSGELGSEEPATVWKPGESHDFVLRMNWPGTGSCPARPLINADALGKYAVCISLVFKANHSTEYVISPPMEIEVRKSATTMTPNAADSSNNTETMQKPPATLKVIMDIPGAIQGNEQEIDSNPIRPAGKDIPLRLEQMTESKEGGQNVDHSVQTKTVANPGEVVFKNLTPGSYDFSWQKMYFLGDFGTGAMCDRQLDLKLSPGETKVIRLVRKRGQRVGGEIRGLPDDVPGAWITVRPVAASGDPMREFDAKEWKLPTFDCLTCQNNTKFLTALLEPGRYRLVAQAFRLEPKTGVWRSGGRLPNFVGTALVTVEDDDPAHAKKLAPRVTIEVKPRGQKPVKKSATHKVVDIPGAIQGNEQEIDSKRVRPAEKFFVTEGVGDEICAEKSPIEITGDQAAQLFLKDASSKLTADWEKHLPAAASQPAPGAKPMPHNPEFLKEIIPSKNTKPTASVAKFSDKHLIIRISRPAGHYLWHHYYENLATVRVERNATLDKVFDLPGLMNTYASSYKGVQQGDMESHMIEVLGRPDAIRTTQAMSFYFADYEKGAVEIAIWNWQVFRIRRVPLDEIRMRKEDAN